MCAVHCAASIQTIYEAANIANDIRQSSGQYRWRIPTLLWAVLKGGDSTRRLNAGLPNISGQIWNVAYQDAYKSSDSSNGAFSKRTADEGTSFIGTTQQYTADGFVFDASDSNAIYGASTTVQPPALQLIPQIKF